MCSWCFCQEFFVDTVLLYIMRLLSVIIHPGNYTGGFLLYTDGMGMLSRGIYGKICRLWSAGFRGDVDVFYFLFWIGFFWDWWDIGGDFEKHGGYVDVRWLIFCVYLLHYSYICYPTTYHPLPRYLTITPNTPQKPSSIISLPSHLKIPKK